MESKFVVYPQYSIQEKFIRYMGWLAGAFFVVAVVMISIRAFVIEPGRVNGRSMEDTFIDENLFLVDKFTPLFIAPYRGNVVQIYDFNTNKVLIKRIIGLPGEVVTISQNNVFITGTDGVKYQLSEPYLKLNTITRTPTGATIEYPPVPSASFFVMGDNRTQSGDSRNFGPIHRSHIIGRVIRLPFQNP